MEGDDDVLVLVSFGLVLLATILLVVGLLTDDGLNLIYLSIACSFTAAVVLYLAFRRARPTHDVKAEPPAPLLPEGFEDEEPAPVAAATPAALAARDRGSDATTVQPAVALPAEDEVNPGATPTADTEAAVDAGADDWVDDDDWADSGDFEVEFPIADYDELGADEILPLLPQLYSDELEVVAERERSTKNRTAILARLAELAATGTEADALEEDEAEQSEAVNPGATPTADTAPAVAVEDDAPPAAAPPAAPAASAAAAAAAAAAPAPRPARPAPQVPSLSDDDWDDEVPFPIADYDELTADQIIPLLSQLEDDELEDVKDREVAGQGRKSVITEIDRQLGLVGAAEAADEWSEPAPAPVPPRAAQTPAPAAPTPAPAPDPRPAPVAETADSAMLAISGYDGLTVAEIRPLLAGLSHAELRAVRDHEAARDNRRTIIADIERRLGSPEAAPAAAPAARPAAKRAPRKQAARPTKAAARKATKRAAKKAAANHRFPIEGYDTLTVAQIKPRLARLDARQLEQVRARELSGAGRKTILTEIDRRLP